MLNYIATTLTDVQAHLQSLQADALAKEAELKAEGDALPWGSGEQRWNDFARREVHGELLGYARILGYLEARIQIDQIWEPK